MVHLAEIKQISPFLALHIFGAVEDASCLSSLLKRAGATEHKEDRVCIHWDASPDTAEPGTGPISNLASNLKL